MGVKDLIRSLSCIQMSTVEHEKGLREAPDVCGKIRFRSLSSIQMTTVKANAHEKRLRKRAMVCVILPVRVCIVNVRTASLHLNVKRKLNMSVVKRNYEYYEYACVLGLAYQDTKDSSSHTTFANRSSVTGLSYVAEGNQTQVGSQRQYYRTGLNSKGTHWHYIRMWNNCFRSVSSVHALLMRAITHRLEWCKEASMQIFLPILSSIVRTLNEVSEMMTTFALTLALCEMRSGPPVSFREDFEFTHKHVVPRRLVLPCHAPTKSVEFKGDSNLFRVFVSCLSTVMKSLFSHLHPVKRDPVWSTGEIVTRSPGTSLSTHKSSKRSKLCDSAWRGNKGDMIVTTRTALTPKNFSCNYSDAMESESETISLDGKMLEIAPGEEMPEMTDGELEKEMEIDLAEQTGDTLEGDRPSDEEEEVNVTVREVIPSEAKTSSSAITTPSERMHERRKTKYYKPKSSNGKRSSSHQPGRQISLTDMLSNISVSNDATPSNAKKQEKRIRSPSTGKKATDQRPQKIFKEKQKPVSSRHSAQHRLARYREDGDTPSDDAARPGGRSEQSTGNSSKTEPTTTVTSGALQHNTSKSSENQQHQPPPTDATAPEQNIPSRMEPSYSETTGPSAISITPLIRKFLSEKVFQDIEANSFAPTFEDNRIGSDGLYLTCSNFSSSEWVIKTISSATEFKESKLVVVPANEVIQFTIAVKHVRVVTTIPTRKESHDILKALAHLNKNLNTEKWRITRKRPSGATKSIVYMRMDEQSYETIAKQSHRINWLLGTIDVTLERHGKKPNDNHSPASEMAAPGDVNRGYQSRNHYVQPPPSGVWKGPRRSDSRVRNDKTRSTGNTNPPN